MRDAVRPHDRLARPAAARSAPARPGTARPTAGRAAAAPPATSASVMSSCSSRAARHVPTMISGCRNTPRSWSMTSRLDLRRRHPPDRAGLRPALQHVLADVVAVEPVALAGVRRRHRRAGRPEDQPLQQRRRLRPGARGAGAGVLGEDRVHLVPEILADDRRVLARVRRALVHRQPEVGPVVQQVVERALVERLAAWARPRPRPAAPAPAPSPSRSGRTARRSLRTVVASGSCTTSFRFSTR